MSRLSTALTVAAFLLPLGAVSHTAHAQQISSYDLRSNNLEIFIDQRGRRFIADPYTGEILGRANRNARFSRRDRIRAERAYQRALRQNRYDDGYDNDAYVDDYQDRRASRPRRDRRSRGNGFYLDEYDQNDRSRSRRREPSRVEAHPLPDVLPNSSGNEGQGDFDAQRKTDRDETEVASLPVERGPVQVPSAPIGMIKPNYSRSMMAKLQVFLDREGFSPGVIDGRWGQNVARAADMWKQAKASKKDLGDASTLNQLLRGTNKPVFTQYTITQKDIKGPYVSNVPVDYGRKSKLKRLSYTSVPEMLAERFHMSKAYLEHLNKGANFRAAGTTINVVAPGNPVWKKVHYLIADKARNQLRGYDRNGQVVASYPATIGSASTPSPSGKHSIARIALNPQYTYNPKKNFQQGNNNKVLTIAPGPNGPVGSVWIALSKPTYGIHGTPNPELIGKTNSHGCIRLTNWDATELAKLVREGVTVEFVE